MMRLTFAATSSKAFVCHNIEMIVTKIIIPTWQWWWLKGCCSEKFNTPNVLNTTNISNITIQTKIAGCCMTYVTRIWGMTVRYHCMSKCQIHLNHKNFCLKTYCPSIPLLTHIKARIPEPCHTGRFGPYRTESAANWHGSVQKIDSPVSKLKKKMVNRSESVLNRPEPIGSASSEPVWTSTDQFFFFWLLYTYGGGAFLKKSENQTPIKR